MSDTLISDVSDTAFWIANHRARETGRPDALFRDPWAAQLAGDHGRQIADTMPMSVLTGWSVVIRTCIIDDYIRSAVAAGADTVLNLGAGLDTRPYRMAELGASLNWIEADYAHVIDYKESKLAGVLPRCQLERVKIDLADAQARREFLAGIDRRAGRMLVLTEGVVPYLSVDEAASLADDLRGLGHVAGWVVDYFSPEVIKFRMNQRGMRQKMRNAPFKFEPKDWFAFFRERGWRLKEMRYLMDEGERLKRTLPLPGFLKFMMILRGFFASEEQRSGYRKFAGYALLEPAIAA